MALSYGDYIRWSLAQLQIPAEGHQHAIHLAEQLGNQVTQLHDWQESMARIMGPQGDQTVKRQLARLFLAGLVEAILKKDPLSRDGLQLAAAIDHA